ncbi:MAG: hypothetical protein LBJ43_02900 [Propionibacteriaceae bacterium]|nr:hypothetical protein [Propionibacteriaceae bacterium]
MALPAVAIDISRQLKAELETRYRRGEIDKNRYLIEKSKLQERIEKGLAIKRTPFGMGVKVFLVVLLLISAAFFGFLTYYYLGATGGFNMFMGYIFAAAQLGSAVWVLLRP